MNFSNNETSLTDVNLGFFNKENNIEQLTIKSLSELSVYHNVILDILGISTQNNDYKISEVTKFLVNETSVECNHIVFRDIVLWNEGISSEISKSLYSTLQSFKNINISEYYHLIFSFVPYIKTSEGGIKEEFNIEELKEDFQLRGDFSFIENLLDSKVEELYFLLDWSDHLLYDKNDNSRDLTVHINDTLNLTEIQKILREIREITAISGLIMQVSSKNIGITDNVIGFFNFLKKYQSELSTFTTGLSKQLSLEKGDDVWKLQNIGLLILSELKLIEIGNSHLLDYSNLDTAQEVRSKYSYQLNLMNSGMNRIKGTKFEEDKRFMFLKENYSVHKAKMFLQFCNVIDEKKINNKYIGVDLDEIADPFVLSPQEKEDKISSENCLVFTYSALLNKQGILVDYKNVEDVIIDLTNRVNNGDKKLEKLMNIAFYIYAYGKISDANILEKLSGALYSRQFDKEKEYGMYVEGLRITQSYGRQRAYLENMKMKLSSINDNAEVAKQELEKTNTMLGEANNKLEETNVKLEEANDKLAILATTDELTQVKNRKAFDTELKEFISLVGREKASLVNAVVMFDIDKFKDFNDSYGHTIGDEVLKKFAGTIMSKIRLTDKFFRYGGEEFSMLISCDTLENLLKILNDLRRSVSEVEYCYDNKELHITVSIGFSVLDAESVKNKVNFVDQADKALYDSKDNGRNQVTMYKESIIKSD